MPAIAIAADVRPIEMEGVDQGDHVVGQQVVRDRPARVNRAAGAAEVGHDDSEMLREGLDIAEVR